MKDIRMYMCIVILSADEGLPSRNRDRMVQ